MLKALPFWPRSLKNQVLLALALALLLAQTIGAAFQYKVQVERRRDQQVHMFAFRVLNAWRRAGEALPPRARQAAGPMERPPFDGPPPERAGKPGGPPPGSPPPGPPPAGPPPDGGPFRLGRPFTVASFAPLPGERRLTHTEDDLRQVFAEQDVRLARVVVVERAVAADAAVRAMLAQRPALLPGDGPPPDRFLVAAIQRKPGGEWLVTRAFAPGGQPHMLAILVGQTLLIYVVLVAAMALILRRITRPLAQLTTRLERFARERSREGQLEPQGPDDLRRLILAHNAMESRILALLDEKDVMLGAIGHDLKTPLAALRVRIESVEDEHERARMADTIDDLARSLDDMLSLARVGRPTDPLEATELSALVAAIAEEYEDMGEPVELVHSLRVVLPLRATWLRRALRNLIGNALRYGKVARVEVAREPDAAGTGWAVVRVEDDGPGIPEGEIAAMLEPFTRGEPSRNTHTGGAGLGLTLARAIAEQHGGTLTLANRRDPTGPITGLTATLRLPMKG